MREPPPLRPVPPGALRWAVRLSSWRLEAEPKLSMEFNFLLNLIQDEAERIAVLRFVRSVDQKRALLSRLLALRACASELEMPHEDVVIQRTAGRKPFAATKPPGSAYTNFNFNVSHEGDFVVLAAEPTCLCGVDVCSAAQLRLPADGARLVDELRRSFDAQFAASEWTRIERAPDDARALDLFKTLWSCKEALVKARGDGLQFDLSRIAFEPRLRDRKGRWKRAIVRVDGGPPDRDWRFDVEHLDRDHVSTVALGPVSAIVDRLGDFKATMLGPRADPDGLRAPRPGFSLLAVDDLVPESRLPELRDIRLRFGIPPSPSPKPLLSADADEQDPPSSRAAADDDLPQGTVPFLHRPDLDPPEPPEQAHFCALA
ncbi:hypothetical protein CTAYLR_007390 [Chrysophaeum taylorii]|uniref:holo-[acyl-carrier-protein] synthase n=1 Tax=Chrysophaeum taylorii TaxID=2483200 RepID=A0AAD7XEF7_9STRA|nr:hypothetical protein CTAYLR_007390 [Chrysophaeum taylorii]